jgi:hypothetical protein
MDQELSEVLAEAQDALDSGDYGEMAPLIEVVEDEIDALPEAVWDAIALKVGPLRTDACEFLAESVVPSDAFDEAMEALEQLEEANPGSTGNAQTLLGEIWIMVYMRNELIVEYNEIGCAAQ